MDGRERKPRDLSKFATVDASRSAIPVAARVSSKEISLPNGKENARPSSANNAIRGSRKLSFESNNVAATTACQTRVFLGSNEERRREPDTSSEHARASRVLLNWNRSGKKPKFHVHCDDRNVVVSETCDTQERSRRDSTATSTATSTAATIEKPSSGRDDWKQLKTIDGNVEETGNSSKLPQLPQKRSTTVGRYKCEVPRDGKKKPLPSRIPRRSTSSSVRSVQTDEAASAVFRRSTYLSFASSGHPAIAKREKIDDDDEAHERLAFVTKNGASIVVARRQDGSTTTPVDGPPPPPVPSIPLKAAIRRSKFKVNSENSELEQPEIEEESKQPDSFPGDLLYHVEYHDDLPMIEREREERSPRLSSDFLAKHINAEQRRLLVIFMIRLGTHCRYPSRIVYQSVKLFDAVTDRIFVETRFIQLTALASLWIALKKQENFHKIPMATKMVSLAKDLYLGREDLLIAYERRILQTLDFNITFADAFTLYAHHLISCSCHVNVSTETSTFLYYCGCYVIDVTLLDEEFCRTSASLIALTTAELVLGLVLDGPDNGGPRWLFWRGLLFAAVPRLTGWFRDQEIDRTRVAMLRRVLNSGKKHCGFEVVYKKYSRSRYDRISESFVERATRVSQTETFFDP